MKLIVNNESNRDDQQREQPGIDPMYTDETLIVLEKFKVNVSLLDMANSELEDVLPLLLQDTMYCAEELIGAELWADLTSTAHRQLHLCLQHIAGQPGARLVYSPLWDQSQGGFMITGNQ